MNTKPIKKTNMKNKNFKKINWEIYFITLVGMKDRWYNLIFPQSSPVALR